MKKRDWIFLIGLLFLFIIIYLATLGTLDISSHRDEKESFEEKRRKAIHRHGKLKELINKKEELKKKLEKKFKLIYLAVRIGLLFIVAVYNLILYFQFEVKELGDFMNWNEVALIGIGAILFLRFGSITNIQNIVAYFKARIENRVYKKYVSLDDEINNYKGEVKEIESQFTTKNTTLDK